ncbi:MAG: hypothetical protein ACJ746_11390 [Bryobacteraceae bacterium]
MFRSYEPRFSYRAGAIWVAFVLSAVPAIMAQSTPAPEWSLVMITTVKPEMRSDYEAFQKEMSAAYKKAQVPSRAVLQTVMGNLLEYISVAPLAHFADMDGPSPVERALGKADAEGLIRKGVACTTSAHREASLALKDLSIHTKTQENFEYAMITSYHLVTGKEAEFSAWMKNDYIPAMKKAEVKNFWVSQTVFGGDPNERIAVRLIKNLAEFDAGPVLTKALGEEGALKVRLKSTGIVDSVHYSVLHYRPDLSYDTRPAQMASAK